MVGRNIGVLEGRGDFILPGGDLVVAGLDRHAEFVELLFDISHECKDAIRNRAKVMVVQLMTLGRCCAEERSAAHQEIRAAGHIGLVHKEILLLAADGRDDAADALIRSKDAKDAHCLFIHGVDGTEQRGLLVECLARP